MVQVASYSRAIMSRLLYSLCKSTGNPKSRWKFCCHHPILNIIISPEWTPVLYLCSYRGVGTRGAGGATAPHFCWKLTKIAEKYGFFLKIHVFCPPPTFGFTPPLLSKFQHPCSTEEPYPHKSSRLGNNIRLVLNNLFWISSSFVRKQKSWRDLGRLLLRQKISICLTCQTKVVKKSKKSRVKILKKNKQTCLSIRQLHLSFMAI